MTILYCNIPEFHVAVVADRDHRRFVDPGDTGNLCHAMSVLDLAPLGRMIEVPDDEMRVESARREATRVGRPSDAIDACRMKAPFDGIRQFLDDRLGVVTVRLVDEDLPLRIGDGQMSAVWRIGKRRYDARLW